LERVHLVNPEIEVVLFLFPFFFVTTTVRAISVPLRSGLVARVGLSIVEPNLP
jgi:hypothetical protein